MSSATPSYSIESDKQLAIQLQQQEIRTNPKRKAASTYATSQYVTEHAPKRIARTPKQLPEDSDTSSLSAPPDSPELSTITTASQPFFQESSKNLSDGIDKPKKVNGLTEITVTQADILSNPPPGDELYRLAEAAKERKEISKSYDASVLRFVDGKWMAPQMCIGYSNTLIRY